MIDFTELYFAAIANGFSPTHKQVETIVLWCEGFYGSAVYLDSGTLTSWPRGTTPLVLDNHIVPSPWSSALCECLRPWFGERS